MRWMLLLFGLLGAFEAAAFSLPARWIHGAPGEPVLQVHAAAPGFWIIRQSKASNFEAPFLYLIAGEQSALLLDSGAEPAARTKLPLRETVDRLLADWAKTHGLKTMPLVVAHSHSHRDHIYGDAQFRDRADTRIIAARPEEVAAFFGLDRWPEGEARFDLGRRTLTILPLPGHEPAHIAVYDEQTGSLLSGDTLYPGLLTIRDWPAYRASAERLAAFAASHRVERVLGAHVEMSATPGLMYPLGSALQPDEHTLALGSAHIQQLRDATSTLGDFLHQEVRDDFILGRVKPYAGVSDLPSTHGMLLVGTDVVYLSHLPMFHSPHNYQLIFEAALPDKVLNRYRADSKAHPDALYTVAPTRQWVLPAQILEKGEFKLDLYRGHFERGGVLIERGVPVSVARIVQFRRFEPGRSPDAGQWIAFGRGREHFLAHRIEGPPDMDQVVQVTKSAPEGRALQLGTSGAMKAGDAVNGGKVARVIYTEYGDLQR